MEINRRDKWNITIAALMLIVLLVVAFFVCQQAVMRYKQEARTILSSYEMIITLNLLEKFNYADLLNGAVTYSNDTKYFAAAAQNIMKQPEAAYVGILRGTQAAAVYPSSAAKYLPVGENIKQLNYAYTLARLTKNMVVEGPVMQDDKQLFLNIQPLFSDDYTVFLGESVVAWDHDAVIAALRLDKLTASGYEYELWRVHPLNGTKQQIAVSAVDVDFSQGVETKFKLPATWTLSIIPIKGWYDQNLIFLLVGSAIMFSICIGGLLHFYGQKVALHKKLFLTRCLDFETGFLQRASFLEKLNSWQASYLQAFSLLYITIDNYNYFSQISTGEQKAALQQHIKECFHYYVKSEHITARLGEGNFAIAINENLTDYELECLRKGLTIELLWHYSNDKEKLFITAHCSGGKFSLQNETAEELLQRTINAHYETMINKNPVRNLADKCEKILNGETDVLLGEYPDLELNRLAKILNRYRKIQ